MLTLKCAQCNTLELQPGALLEKLDVAYAFQSI